MRAHPQRPGAEGNGRQHLARTPAGSAWVFVPSEPEVRHSPALIREDRYLYNYVVGLALVVAGIAAVWIGVWALFPLTDGLGAAQAATGRP